MIQEQYITNDLVCSTITIAAARTSNSTFSKPSTQSLTIKDPKILCLEEIVSVKDDRFGISFDNLWLFCRDTARSVKQSLSAAFNSLFVSTPAPHSGQLELSNIFCVPRTPLHQTQLTHTVTNGAIAFRAPHISVIYYLCYLEFRHFR